MAPSTRKKFGVSAVLFLKATCEFTSVLGRPKRKRKSCFFFNDTATTEIYTLSLHDALPIPWRLPPRLRSNSSPAPTAAGISRRSEEHTSELQSRLHLVCRLLLEKKKTRKLCKLSIKKKKKQQK